MLGSWKGVVGRVLAVALPLAATEWTGLGTAAAAELERQIESPAALPNDPVVITKVTLGSAMVQAGRFIRPSAPTFDPVKPFQAGDDWIQNLAIQFLNRTDLPIVFAVISLGFPETGDGRTQPMRGCQLRLGQEPPGFAIDRSGKAVLVPPSDRPPLWFGPGQTDDGCLGRPHRPDQVRRRVCHPARSGNEA
jgi:hypothetical protein